MQETPQSIDVSEPIQEPLRIKKIPLMEVFGPTFQGEGLMAGCQTYFFRFGLCDYDCSFCDSRHAIEPELVRANAFWGTQGEIYKKFQQVVVSGLSYPRWVTFSGGNPCIHNLTDLTALLKKDGFQINVETQGTKSPDWLQYVDLITVSPKTPGIGEKFNAKVFKEFLHKVAIEYERHVCIKVVVFSKLDLEYAHEIFEHARMLENNSGRQLFSYYLSLGNPYPPMHDNTIHLEGESTIRAIPFDDLLKLKLLADYRAMCEDILQDSRFGDIYFLPQIHVLTWANKAEV